MPIDHQLEHVYYNGAMQHHYRLLSDTKQQYRQIFQQHQAALEAQLLALREHFHCERCTSHPDETLAAWLAPFARDCGYRAWQQAILSLVETEIAGQILAQLQRIEAYKQTFSCHMCGMCCKMASTDAPYETLQQRAAEGDEFARQFTSIFLPYASREAARQVAPTVVDAALAEAVEEPDGEEKLYFYHCPYLGEDNRCTVYGTDKRPAICSSYPETPLSFVYKNCSWRPWKEDTHMDTLLAHAMLALCTQLSEKLRDSLAN
jgi:Fe-S-cluster containining protein